MLVLGLETTCDETSVALVRDGREVLCNLISSQIDLHAKFGGVVPEIAARKHVEALNPLLDQALSETGIRLQDVDALAVANRPGLMGAVLTGVAAAKALALVLKVPLVGVHHL
ncbi:MAG TPA: tRNA (adenosine(37)-N6)-threonylcarbamoyltransferase complex transferase subunit TsaD, partial [Armatimonadota bacterium]